MFSNSSVAVLDLPSALCLLSLAFVMINLVTFSLLAP
jgi:hypothetical protein